MKLKWPPRTSSWPSNFGLKKIFLGAQNGLVPLALCFFFFLLLGISTLLLTQIYLRIGGLRRNLDLSRLAAENGLKMGYLFLWEKVQTAPWPLPLSESEWEAMSLAPQPEETAAWLFSRSFGLDFPLSLQSNWQNMTWSAQADFRPPNVESLSSYALAKTEIELRAKGKITAFPRASSARLSIDTALVAGYLPLPIFPLLIEKPIPPDEQDSFLRSKKIAIQPVDRAFLSAKPFFSSAEIISRDVNPFLQKAFKMRLFRPDNINPLILREVLGLERVAEPVPTGVYLIRDDLGLGGVFIQGDLDELLLATDESYQVVFFRQAEKTWELRFNPSLNQTIWQTPEKHLIYDGCPNGVILINGNINSCGGAEISRDGESLVSSPAPSLIPGIKLALVTSGKINITSAITQPNLEIKPGIPYQRESQTQVVIFSNGKDLITDEEREAGLCFDIRNAEELVVEADLTILGRGIYLSGSGKRVVIKGSLQTNAIDNNEKEIKIIPHENVLSRLKMSDLWPLTCQPLTGIIFWRATQWSDDASENL